MGGWLCVHAACAQPHIVLDHAPQARPVVSVADQLRGLGFSEVSCCGVVMVVADNLHVERSFIRHVYAVTEEEAPILFCPAFWVVCCLDLSMYLPCEVIPCTNRSYVSIDGLAVHGDASGGCWFLHSSHACYHRVLCQMFAIKDLGHIIFHKLLPIS